jgi:hypothetical protein
MHTEFLTRTAKVLIRSSAEFLSTLDALIQFQRMHALARHRAADALDEFETTSVPLPAWFTEREEAQTRYSRVVETAGVLDDAFLDAAGQFTRESARSL